MPTPRSSAPRLRLTRRGRLARTLLVLLALLVLVGAVVRGCMLTAGADGEAVASAGAAGSSSAGRSDGGASDGGGADGASDGGGAGEPAAATAERRPGGHATTTDADGMVHSDMRGTGEFTTAPAQQGVPASGDAAAEGAGRAVRHYLVQVEGGTGIDASGAAEEIQQTLTDPRGWGPIEKLTFVRVSDPARADFTITIAAPSTVDRLCAPLETRGTWNCHSSTTTVLNADRWLYMTPTYSDLADYHRYQVNHEVGHYLGRGHEHCAGTGRAAPVMLQQSMTLEGCRPNPWPTDDGAA